MRIGEVARCAGVSTRAVRYYEEQGLVHADRDHNGYRVYGPESVGLVREIARLLRLGLNTDDVAMFVGCLGRGEPPSGECVDLLRIYSERLGALNERIRALTEVRDRLAAETDRIAEHMADR
ncbi:MULTISPECIES: MerR family transcriptional regulator [Actinomadura]|uniref:MerR family transcriptional regulator n=1 Tax=Actinomadura TaxID=1988 RepID=UPI0003FDE4EB|nr:MULTISPECIES: MerR family transcriptional regulator [Actinomadura]RSN68126.1 MerR family DNA-binding transcriptional regulator [Actinomadura sp. WAC 06369]